MDITATCPIVLSLYLSAIPFYSTISGMNLFTFFFLTNHQLYPNLLLSYYVGEAQLGLRRTDENWTTIKPDVHYAPIWIFGVRQGSNF